MRGRARQRAAPDFAREARVWLFSNASSSPIACLPAMALVAENDLISDAMTRLSLATTLTRRRRALGTFQMTGCFFDHAMCALQCCVGAIK